MIIRIIYVKQFLLSYFYIYKIKKIILNIKNIMNIYNFVILLLSLNNKRKVIINTIYIYLN